MKIRTDNTSFKSGLTLKLLRDFKKINVKEAESDFAQAGIDANFLENKFLCGSSVLTANILNEISGKYKLPFDFLPPAIRAYSDKNLVDTENKNCDGFCSCDTQMVLKNEPPFIGNSIFLNNITKSALKTNFLATIDGLCQIQSTTHFLHTVLHEWFHCIHHNLIFTKFGYEGDCPVLREKYYKQDAGGLEKLLRKDNMYSVKLLYSDKVKKYISEYAVDTSLRSEIFAELMSKITAKSLDKKLNIIKNPLDNIPQKLPPVIKMYIEEMLEI